MHFIPKLGSVMNIYIPAKKTFTGIALSLFTSSFGHNYGKKYKTHPH